MSTLTVTQALAKWFSKPMLKLPRELRPIAEAYIKEWSSLSADERRARAAEVDRQRVVKTTIKLARVRREQERQENDPLTIAEDTIGWWDANMSASFWWGQPSITPHQGALILCRYNPNDFDGADPEKDSTDETAPDDYAHLVSAFIALDRVMPAHRILSEWLAYAESRNLKHHTWIVEYALAVNTLRQKQCTAAGVPVELAERLKPVAPASTGNKSGAPCQDRQFTKREQQIAVIEKAIASLGYDPLNVPRGGKKEVGVECRRDQPTLFGGGPDPFREAWQEALRAGRVRTVGHDIYAGRR